MPFRILEFLSSLISILCFQILGYKTGIVTAMVSYCLSQPCCRCRVLPLLGLLFKFRHPESSSFFMYKRISSFCFFDFCSCCLSWRIAGCRLGVGFTQQQQQQHSLQYLCLENPNGWGSVGNSPRVTAAGHEQIHFNFTTGWLVKWQLTPVFLPGEPWWAAVIKMHSSRTPNAFGLKVVAQQKPV